MKAVVAAFNPGEGPSRGLLRDCTTSPMDRFTALVPTTPTLALLWSTAGATKEQTKSQTGTGTHKTPGPLLGPG